MEAKAEEVKISSLPEVGAKASSSKPPKRKGKGSAQRSLDQMRERKGRPILEKYRADLRRKLLGDESGELEVALTNMSLTTQERAKPISVSTRGVGIVSSVEYSRIVTTWSMEAIVEICSIYSFYRVTLFMSWFKLALAQQVQYEPKSFNIGEDIIVNEEHRQLMMTIYYDARSHLQSHIIIQSQ